MKSAWRAIRVRSRHASWLSGSASSSRRVGFSGPSSGRIEDGEPFDLDHLVVDALLEVAVLVDHVGDAAAHPGSEVPAGFADHDDTSTGHVLAAVVADPFDDGDGAGVADGETFPGSSVEVAVAGDGAIQHGVADDDVLFRHDRAGWFGLDDDPPTGQSLADVVVGVTFEMQRDAACQPGAEALARGALQLDRESCRVADRRGRSDGRPRRRAWRRP